MRGVEKLGHHGGVCATAQHADFHRGDLHVFGERIELRAKRRGRSRVDGLHALRGLHGQRGHRRHAVAIVRGESFQVRAHARAAGRIEARDASERWGRNDDCCSTRCVLRPRHTRQPPALNVCNEPETDFTRVVPRNARLFSVVERLGRLSCRRCAKDQGKSPRARVASATRPTAST